MAVQVNGRTPVTISVPPTASRDEIGSLLAGHPGFAEHTSGRAIERLVVVPGRVVNVVTSAASAS